MGKKVILLAEDNPDDEYLTLRVLKRFYDSDEIVVTRLDHDANISPWLLVVTFFLSLFLGLCKRRHEFLSMLGEAGKHRSTLDAYSIDLLDQLINMTHGRTAGPFERSIDVLVSRLRQKLEKDPKSPSMIQTVRSEGYMLSAPVNRV